MNFIQNIPPGPDSDEQLLIRYKQTNDLDVLGELYQRYMDLIYGVCLKYLKDSETAKDAVMQIFEELVKKLHKHEIENFKGWLYQVAKNHCLMQLRAGKKMKMTDIDPVLVQTGENVHLNGDPDNYREEKEESFTKMEYCLSILPADQQNAIRLFYLEGKSYQEIVNLTGAEWNQVRSNIQNGRRNLKTCMEKKMNVQAGKANGQD